MAGKKVVIDGMQYANWSRKVFTEMREGQVDAVHVTVAYHGNFRETVDRLVEWRDRLRIHRDLIAFAGSAAEIDLAIESGRTAILFGLQNPSPIEADIGLVEALHQLGVRFMQLAYNNQSLLCTGWTEKVDTGLTNMGREVVREMNSLGMVIDMSHAAERSILEAIDYSQRPVVVSHANPFAWKATKRNVSDAVLQALGQSDGLIGLSLYPGHLSQGTQTTLDDFCTMAAGLAEKIGAEHIGIGSDLCQDQPASALAWMRDGKWRRPAQGVEAPSFPDQPDWFKGNLDLRNVAHGLARKGFTAPEVEGIMGGNWYRFLSQALRPGSALP